MRLLTTFPGRRALLGIKQTLHIHPLARQKDDEILSKSFKGLNAKFQSGDFLLQVMESGRFLGSSRTPGVSPPFKPGLGPTCSRKLSEYSLPNQFLFCLS